MNTPAEIAEQYVKIGAGKAAQPLSKTLVLAILAGLFIGFGAAGSTVAAATVPQGSVAKLVSACIFPGGLTLVLLAGSELFTGNCLLSIPLLERKITLRQMLRNWAVVYLGNFIGAVCVALCLTGAHLGGLFDGAVASSLIGTAAGKCSLSWSDALLRGVACNFLVCIAVWIAFASKTPAGKVIGLFFPIMLFVVCGFEHSVANMFYIPAGLLAAADPAYASAAAEGLTWGSFLLRNLLPVTAGNILGGSVLVGMGYWFVYLKQDGGAAAVTKEAVGWER